MNCPSRTDEPLEGDGHNQNPNDLSNDLTTNQDLNGLANARVLRRSEPPSIESAGSGIETVGGEATTVPSKGALVTATTRDDTNDGADSARDDSSQVLSPGSGGNGSSPFHHFVKTASQRAWRFLRTYIKHIGPGFMIAVAYSTDESLDRACPPSKMRC
jgi:metal iron transporter